MAFDVFNDLKFNVDMQGDHYGPKFWQNFQNLLYEPDTVNFVRRFAPNSIFLDVGAANGAFSLLAGVYAKKLIAYEPDPRVFSVLKKNVELNRSIIQNVILKNGAVSNFNGEIIFSNHSDSKVISEIVFTGQLSQETIKIPVFSLASEIESVHENRNIELVIKIDIEGAEWKMLSDSSVIRSLHDHSALLLLAVHPGFYRPHKKKIKLWDRLTFSLWAFRNRIDSRKLFEQISKKGNIYRTNFNPVLEKKNFVRLVDSGYHEFIIDFGKRFYAK